jgi:hypothetical protein
MVEGGGVCVGRGGGGEPWKLAAAAATEASEASALNLSLASWGRSALVRGGGADENGRCTEGDGGGGERRRVISAAEGKSGTERESEAGRDQRGRCRG